MSVCILCVKPVLKYTRSRISLHKFPVCPNKRQIWINRCKLTNEKILPHHKICSLHFKPSCFKSGVIRRKLYPDAKPTIFKKSHAEITNMPFKNVKIKTGKSSKMSQSCILCEKPVFKYPSLKKSFHRFPVCPKKRQIWLNRCGLTNEEVLPNHKICSFHFNPSCFTSSVIRPRLNPDAEPTIFKKDHAKITNMPPKNVKGRSKNCDKKEIAFQHRRSRDILKTVKAVKKSISSQKWESCDISPTKVSKKVIAGQNSESRDDSSTKSVQKGISGQKYESCDFSSIKVSKEVIAGQSRKSCDNVLTKAFEEEVLEHSLNILTNQKIEFEELDRTIEKLKKSKTLLLSQLKVARNRLSRINTKK